jgi:HK97 gp10 family phage protein
MPSDEVVEGLQELLASMDGISLVRQKNLIARSLRKAMQPTKELAAKRAPDDPETPGSRVAEAMSVSVIEQTATGAIGITGPTKHGFPGIFEEVGTAHQAGKPWLGPAFDETQDEDYEILGDELLSGIEKEFARNH